MLPRALRCLTRRIFVSGDLGPDLVSSATKCLPEPPARTLDKGGNRPRQKSALRPEDKTRCHGVAVVSHLILRAASVSPGGQSLTGDCCTAFFLI
jgi:hypothetical protein